MAGAENGQAEPVAAGKEDSLADIVFILSEDNEGGGGGVGGGASVPQGCQLEGGEEGRGLREPGVVDRVALFVLVTK